MSLFSTLCPFSDLNSDLPTYTESTSCRLIDCMLIRCKFMTMYIQKIYIFSWCCVDSLTQRTFYGVSLSSALSDRFFFFLLFTPREITHERQPALIFTPREQEDIHGSKKDRCELSQKRGLLSPTSSHQEMEEERACAHIHARARVCANAEDCCQKPPERHLTLLDTVCCA